VLFTDIVDSTERARAVGDQRWRELLELHDQAARRPIDQAGGRLIKSTGDDILAVLDGPGRGLRCVLALRAEPRASEIEIRAGLHTGEVDLRSDDVGGIAVQIGARIMAAAGPGEILVSAPSGTSWSAPTSRSRTAGPTRSRAEATSGSSAPPGVRDPRLDGASPRVGARPKQQAVPPASRLDLARTPVQECRLDWPEFRRRQKGCCQTACWARTQSSLRGRSRAVLRRLGTMLLMRRPCSSGCTTSRHRGRFFGPS
jgi:hypothetical protein